MTNYRCRICNSNLRAELEELLLQRVPFRQIADKYLNEFQNCNLHLLEQSVANHRKHIPRPLSDHEKGLLLRFDRGEVGMDEMSRIVALKVFTRVLENPDQLQFIDFFRTELLKIKHERATKSDGQAKEMWGKLFGGFSVDTLNR